MQSSIDNWPRQVNSPEELPQYFLEQYETLLGETNLFPYTLYLPVDRRGARSNKEFLVSLTEEKLFIFEKQKTQINFTCYRLEDIIYIKKGTMLLYSWIEILGYDQNELKSTMVDFNTIAKKLFQELLIKLRSKSGNFEDLSFNSTLAIELSKFDHLATPDYKFMNYARESIISNECVEATVLQPAIRRPYLWYFKRLLCSAHMHILTDKELIIIKEDDISLSKYKTKKYLAVWTFIPLQKIQSIAVEKNEADEALDLVVELPWDKTYRSAFELSYESELNSLVQRLNSIPQSN